MVHNSSSRSRTLIVLFGLLISALLLYSNSLKSPLMLDDHYFFDVHKENVRFIWRQFIPDMLRSDSPEHKVHDAYYRPLAHVIPMMSYLAFGKDPFGHHLVNLVLFWFAAAMVYFFVRMLFVDELLAFLTAVFYLFHPINGIMVNYATASVFSAQVIFMLAGLMCLVAGLNKEGGKVESAEIAGTRPSGIVVNRWPKFLLHFLSVVFFILSLLCHETAMAFPFYAVVVLWGSGKYSLIGSFKRVFLLFGILFIYFLLRMYFSSLQLSIFRQYGYFQMNAWEFLATMSKMILWYVRQLFSPDGIVIIWAAKVIRSQLAVWAGLSLALAGAIAFIMYRSRHDRPLCAGFLIFLIGLILSVPASLFQPTRAMIIEPHWFSFSVIGFFLVIASIVRALKPKIWVLRISVATILFSWGVAGHCYNSLWADEKAYCYYWMERAPDYSGAVAAHLAKAYEIDGNYDLARIYYQRSLTGHPLDWLKYFSAQGIMSLREKRFDQANDFFKKALSIDPHSSELWNDLGAVALHQGYDEVAYSYFIRSIREDPAAVLARLNLARSAFKKGRPQEAAGYYREVLDIVPHHEIALVKLLQIYYANGDRHNAAAVSRKLLDISRDPIVLNNLSVIFRSFGMDELSQKALSKLKRNRISDR